MRREEPRVAVADRVLSAIGATRDGALNFPAYFVDIEWSLDEADNGDCVAWAPAQAQNLDPTGRLASMPLALLVDMAGAGAIRQRIGKEVSLPTVSLQIDFVDHPLPLATAVGARARYAIEAGGIAVAESTLHSATGDAVATAHCRYLVHRSNSRPAYVRYPWEEVTSSPATIDDMDEQEARVYELLTRRLPDADRAMQSVGLNHKLFGINRKSTAVRGQGAATQPVGPHLANRRGFVQGGVAAGLGIEACIAAVGSEPGAGDARLRAFGCTYLRPGHIDAGDLEARATVAFAGRRIIHVNVTVASQRGDELTTGSAIFEASSA